MDELLIEVRALEDETRQSAGILSGTLMVYGERAQDRPEMFDVGALRWPETGIVVNEQHSRIAPVVRVIPFLEGQAVKIHQRVPNTQRGRDALTNLREGVFTGLSVEFGAFQEEFRSGLRVIRDALLTGAALVDMGSYASAKAEARERATRGKRRAIWL